MPVMVRPSSWARKALALGWRRTVRPLRTSTALIFRLTTSPWRSLRMVSISGSSGISPASLGFHRFAGHLGVDLLRPEPLDSVAWPAPAEVHGHLLEAALVVPPPRLAHRHVDPVREERDHRL